MVKQRTGIETNITDSFQEQKKKHLEDDGAESLLYLEKIYQQINYNEGAKRDGLTWTGDFYWHNGERDSHVVFEHEVMESSMFRGFLQ